MQPPANARPFPIPVVAFGPGSQPEEDESLDYVVMPRGMSTYQAPRLPEPEDVVGHRGAVLALREVLAAAQAAARGEKADPVLLAGLSAPDLALVNQVLGEGEVSARLLSEAGQGELQIQESVFAGVWRVLAIDADGRVHDTVEAAAVPAALLRAAAADAERPHDVPPLPPEVFNVPSLLTELADQRALWQPGRAAHVVNLTLLPLTPADIAHLDHQLGTGRVLLLSRGYGNCRITNCRVPHTWRVVYYNSQDQVILNAVEVAAIPEVACAAVEDLEDSAARLAEVLEWVDQPEGGAR
jgi:hydrogenase-1 operon protein HyaF